MTDNADKGWLPKSYKKKDEKVVLAAEEPVIEDVVEADESSVEEEAVEVEAPAAEEPAVVPVSIEDEAAEMLTNAIAKEKAKVSEKANAVAFSTDKSAVVTKRHEELQTKIDLLYTTDMWGDKTNYKCTVCPYATLGVDLIRTHVKQHL